MTWMVFIAAALAAGVSSVGVVLATNPVHSALMLVGSLFAVAVLFVLQEAHFLAAVQIVVYAGAVVVLFLFVIMLLGVDRDEVLVDPLPIQRGVAVALGAVTFVGLAVLVGGHVVTGETAARGPALAGDEGNVERIGRSLFTDFIWPFEITAVLLVIAIVGALVLVRERGGYVDEEAARAVRDAENAATRGPGAASDEEASAS